jgi:hypothetical protein
MASIINKSEINSSQKNFENIKEWQNSNRKNSQLPIFFGEKHFKPQKTEYCKR